VIIPWADVIVGCTPMDGRRPGNEAGGCCILRNQSLRLCSTWRNTTGAILMNPTQCRDTGHRAQPALRDGRYSMGREPGASRAASREIERKQLRTWVMMMLVAETAVIETPARDQGRARCLRQSVPDGCSQRVGYIKTRGREMKGPAATGFSASSRSREARRGHGRGGRAR